MSQDWKSHQFVNYGNDVGRKTLKYIGTAFIKFSRLELDSIKSSMRCKYKTATYEVKNIIQDILNFMNISVNSIVIILINNESSQVMNESGIETSIRIYI